MFDNNILKNLCDDCDYSYKKYISEYPTDITGLFSIDFLCGEFGNRFWIKEWEYPDRGVAIDYCPSVGYDMLFLDYRECGSQGETSVVHID
ncbi:hypothetical protein [Clostridium rectalis]|uniref:hypothetical protein n=1 Tax=Clostridium rectalis TaxID=2040295 RepID=UPI001FAA4EDB|nr:hypothetical protein [Clostridium rectalis]